MVILSARGLHFTYAGGIAALDGLDLDVGAGEVLAILGPNGAGKTTLLLHLNGSLRPERDAIHLDGRPAGGDARALAAWRAAVALVLQDPDDQLFAGSVFEDVSFGPLNLDLPEAEVRARAAAALAELGVEDLSPRPIHMLSLGQKRRVAIAGALAMRPRVLVLDEPTAGLDPAGVAHLLSALRRRVIAGTTIVYATHDVDLALAWSDRVALFADGRVLASGPAPAVLADDDLLRRARLRRPTVLQLAETARALDLLPAGAPPPRSAADLESLLRRKADERPGAVTAAGGAEV